MNKFNYVRYERTFRISACAFNGDYEFNLNKSATEVDISASSSIPVIVNAFNDRLKAATRSHGVNFEITIKAEGEVLPGDDDLVDDLELKKIVNNWNNCHLSLLPEFRNMQVNTCTLAQALYRKLCIAYEDIYFVVEVRDGCKKTVIGDTEDDA